MSKYPKVRRIWADLEPLLCELDSYLCALEQGDGCSCVVCCLALRHALERKGVNETEVDVFRERQGELLGRERGREGHRREGRGRVRVGGSSPFRPFL